ncbi:hypothetical protein GWK47_040185 [Chionoecetes opilio]|uniref:Uncharacterized protein n=1 Tax=Chionoecetes opilio TaxID=41210 RepID=A0A8J4YAX5_CHIOP|nr:hypothetical protein GWK47_040185 [Chionoecetes opilio]
MSSGWGGRTPLAAPTSPSTLETALPWLVCTTNSVASSPPSGRGTFPQRDPAGGRGGTTTTARRRAPHLRVVKTLRRGASPHRAFCGAITRDEEQRSTFCSPWSATGGFTRREKDTDISICVSRTQPTLPQHVLKLYLKLSRSGLTRYWACFTEGSVSHIKNLRHEGLCVPDWTLNTFGLSGPEGRNSAPLAPQTGAPTAPELRPGLGGVLPKLRGTRG